MMSAWNTVWEIAGARQGTKQGFDHLSDHALEVLQGFVMEEARDQMQNAMGGLMLFHLG